MKAKVSSLKKGVESTVERLKAKVTNLEAEVETIKVSSKETLRNATTKHTDKVADIRAKAKESKRASTEAMRGINMEHRKHVTKLDREKQGLRQQAQQQRAEYKARIIAVEEQREDLQRFSTDSVVANKKLARELVAQEIRMEMLEAEGNKTIAHNEDLSVNLEVKDQELALARLAAATFQVGEKTLQRKVKKDETKLEEMRTNLKNARQAVVRLEEVLRKEIEARVKVEGKAEKAKLMLQKKSTELEVALSTVAKEKERYNKLQEDMDEVVAAMDELKNQAEELCHIRHTESRGNPLKVQT
jgi:chromosome segregation ATPase